MNWKQSYEWKPFTLLVSAEEVKGNEMKIEAGKYYKTRDGRKVGPIERGEQHNSGAPWFFKFGNNHFEKNGHSCRNGFGFDNNPEDDLISEWKDEPTSPIRTVTRLEIVPGVYGRLHVSRDFSMEDKNLRIALSDCLGKPDPAGHYWNLDELDEAIHTLSQIREVIAEESGK